MAILEILTYPDPRLAQQSSPVTEFGPKLKKLCEDMLETMYAAPGVGLAAPQVNLHKQLVVIDIDYESSEDEPPTLSNKNPLILVNPKIVAREGEQVCKEGCLSVPGEFEEVVRAEKVTVEYQDVNGKSLVLEAEGYLAVAVQHELDHLDGRLFIDRLSIMKGKSIKKRLKREAQK
jgi:peptide deformylase